MMRALSWPLLSWSRLSSPLLGVVAVALGLSGCSNQYFERKDSVTFSAGDAVAFTNAQMIADPTPRRAYDTNIVTPGVAAAHAGKLYYDGQYKWYVDPSNKDEPKETSGSPLTPQQLNDSGFIISNGATGH